MRIASELLFLARELVGIDFPTQDAMDKYLKDHPDADKTNHRVVETKTENKGTADGGDWILKPARYAKGQMAFKHTGKEGMKSRGDRLAEALGGRYTNRERVYILSPKKAEKLVKMLKDGWDANSFSGELIPPDKKESK